MTEQYAYDLTPFQHMAAAARKAHRAHQATIVQAGRWKAIAKAERNCAVLAAAAARREAETERDAAIARAEQAEAALAALHQGEEPYLDQLTVPTPAQWIWRWNRATPAERLDVAGGVISQGDTAYQCVMQNHPARIVDLQQRFADEHATAVTRAQETDRVRRELADAEKRIAAVRAEVAALTDNGRKHGKAVAGQLAARILAALDGPADTPAARSQPSTVGDPDLARVFASLAGARSPAAMVAAHRTGHGLMVHTNPVQEVAGEGLTLNTWLTGMRARRSADGITQEWLDRIDHEGFPAVVDNTLPVGEIHLRPSSNPPTPAPGPSCCICGSLTHGGRAFYENYQGRLFCWPCADGRQPACPLGDQCDGVDCPRRADHGPRPSEQPAAIPSLDGLDADALTRLIIAAEYRRAEIDPDQCPAECAEGHTYKAPCSGYYPNSGDEPEGEPGLPDEPAHDPCVWERDGQWNAACNGCDEAEYDIGSEHDGAQWAERHLAAVAQKPAGRCPTCEGQPRSAS